MHCATAVRQDFIHNQNQRRLTHGTTGMGLETIMLSERSRTQKVRHCMVPFTRNVQNRPVHRNRKRICVCLGLSGRGNETVS